MAIKKVYELAVDLKRTSVRVNIPVLVQGDSAEFRIRLLDNGAELSTEQLTGITKVSMQSGYDAQTVIQTVGTLQGSVAVFRLKKNELFRSGMVQAMVQLEDTDDRISTLRFQYQVIPDLVGNYIPGEQDVTIFQRYINDAQVKIDEINAAAEIMAATDVAQLTVKLAETASKAELDALGKLQMAGTYLTLTDLQSAYPSGAEGLFLVTADGFTYRWNGTAWTQAVKFQSDGLIEQEVYDVMGLPNPIPKTSLTNIQPNGDFSNGTTGWTASNGAIVANNNELEFTVTALSSSARINLSTVMTEVGHKYYAFGWLKPKYKTRTQFYVGVNHQIYEANLIVNEWNFISSIGTATAANIPYFRHQTDSQYVVGDKFSYKYIGLVDLTEQFGAGNEPALEYMDDLLASYNPVNKWFNGTIKIPQLGKNNGKILSVVEGETKMATVDEIYTRYISLSGNDENDGLTFATAYATFQKALDSGAKTIYAERGVYLQSATKHNVSEITILPYNDESYTAGSSVKKIQLRGSDLLASGSWVAHNAIFKQPYAGNSFYQQVFIDKTLVPVTGTYSPESNNWSVNAGLWQGNNKETDVILKPVLTLAECETELGTFFFDGTDLYVNPTDGLIGGREFHAVKLEFGLTLSGGKVELQDVECDFYMRNPMSLNNIKSLLAHNCEANHSTRMDGFAINYTNGRLLDCSAYRNRNDGFNFHFYGDTELVNCNAMHNMDDGCSHHEGCTGVVLGGKYINNRKGGISPASGAKVDVYNALLERNGYGLYNSHSDANPGLESVSSGNLYLNNTYAIRNQKAKLTSFNDVFVGNVYDTIGDTPVNIY